MMSALFVEEITEETTGPEFERTCGSCGETKSTTEFYKDGTKPDGTIRYRRDCKQCYQVLRRQERDAKRVPKRTTKSRRK